MLNVVHADKILNSILCKYFVKNYVNREQTRSKMFARFSLDLIKFI